MYAYYAAKGHIARGPELMGRNGRIDNTSLRLLDRGGVRLNTWGTVADFYKYNNLIGQGKGSLEQ